MELSEDAADDAAKAALAAEQAARNTAAREAVGDKVPVASGPDLVECRVLPMGDGKVSMGMHIGGIGEAHYTRGEIFKIGRQIATRLEKKGFVEISEPAPAPVAPPKAAPKADA